MQPLSEQLHIVTCAGSPDNNYTSVRFAPMSNEQFKADIGHYRLPPPKGWAVLNGSAAELEQFDSNLNRSLTGYIPKKADGAADYLKAAVDGLIHEQFRPTFRALYEVDIMQYPAGYEATVSRQLYPVYTALESLDLIWITSRKYSTESKLHTLTIAHTKHGQLAYEALVRVYGQAV